MQVNIQLALESMESIFTHLVRLAVGSILNKLINLLAMITVK